VTPCASCNPIAIVAIRWRPPRRPYQRIRSTNARHGSRAAVGLAVSLAVNERAPRRRSGPEAIHQIDHLQPRGLSFGADVRGVLVPAAKVAIAIASKFLDGLDDAAPPFD